MAHRFQQRSTPAENLRIVMRAIPWKLLLLIPMMVLIGIPAFYYGSHAGQKVFPGLTHYFYNLSAPASPTPTPYPPFSTVLPQVGSILYTVLPGDSCDEILTVQMHMADASTIFSDANPVTVQALDAALGQNCHELQPGMVLPLSPQYPLVAIGGIVLSITPTSPPQALPTPLINIAQQQTGIDCSEGCQLVVRIAPSVQVNLYVQTSIPVKKGSWVWAQATLARKSVKNFDNYPYADPADPLNGMSLRACDLQVDNTHDDNSLSCDQLLPNTIDDDGGAWLFGVTGPGGLDHWHYPLHFPAGTRVLLWLTLQNNGNLVFHQGNPLYRYDDTTHVYVRV